MFAHEKRVTCRRFSAKFSEVTVVMKVKASRDPSVVCQLFYSRESQR